MTLHVLEQAILASLAPLFAEAEEKGLWFFHHSPDGHEIWCSPEHLRLEQSRGRLIFAPEHWELRNPSGYMKKLLADAHAIVKEYNDMARRLNFEETIEIISHSSNPADAR
jgi:hypothetical protein